jgi:hypothetical protein
MTSSDPTATMAAKLASLAAARPVGGRPKEIEGLRPIVRGGPTRGSGEVVASGWIERASISWGGAAGGAVMIESTEVPYISPEA